MTRTPKKPAKRAQKKPANKIVAGLQEAVAHTTAQHKPRGFWKRLWVAVFGE